jgi:hypothetical protein
MEERRGEGVEGKARGKGRRECARSIQHEINQTFAPDVSFVGR